MDFFVLFLVCIIGVTLRYLPWINLQLPGKLFYLFNYSELPLPPLPPLHGKGNDLFRI